MEQKREDLLKDAASKAWDILVIGGGATGLGVAGDAANRGLRRGQPRAKNPFA
ncbi:glycerol-3-phosphate dehydrogenase [Coraliomargarita sp. CAG:312]|nr:glycerol-3-phosphate dehydrogenase [Coraliomargarita sp. CAG:312]